MFRGLAALFSSGILLNPVALLALVLGLIEGGKFDSEQLVEFFTSWPIYALAVFAAVLYNFTLARRYRDESETTLDCAKMIVNSLGTAVSFMVINILAVLFINFIVW